MEPVIKLEQDKYIIIRNAGNADSIYIANSGVSGRRIVVVGYGLRVAMLGLDDAVADPPEAEAAGDDPCIGWTGDKVALGFYSDMYDAAEAAGYVTRLTTSERAHNEFGPLCVSYEVIGDDYCAGEDHEPVLFIGKLKPGATLEE